MVAVFGEFSSERVGGGMRAHHDTCGEAGTGRGDPDSGQTAASCALVEASVDRELAELFAFGVRAAHKYLAGTGGSGVDFIVEIYAGVSSFHCNGADARRIQNRTITLGMHILLHSLRLSVLSEATLQYSDPPPKPAGFSPIALVSHHINFLPPVIPTRHPRRYIRQ